MACYRTNKALELSGALLLAFLLPARGNARSVLPNPTHGAFSVMLPERSSSVRIEVKDVADRTVLVKQFKDVEHIQLELDALAGVYMIHVYRGEERSMFKLVKN